MILAKTQIQKIGLIFTFELISTFSMVQKIIWFRYALFLSFDLNLKNVLW